MPLRKCTITAAWRAKGCMTDALIIEPKGARRKAEGEVPETATLAASPAAATPAACGGTSVLDGGHSPVLPRVAPPLTTASAPAAAVAAPVSTPSAMPMAAASVGSSTAGQTGATSSNSGRASPPSPLAAAGGAAAAAAAVAEAALLVPPRAGHECILAAQTNFIRVFPFQQYDARLQPGSAALDGLKELLRGEHVVGFIGLAVHHLYWALLRPHGAALRRRRASLDAAERDSRVRSGAAYRSTSGEGAALSTWSCGSAEQGRLPSDSRCGGGSSEGTINTPPPPLPADDDGDADPTGITRDERDALFAAAVQAFARARAAAARAAAAAAALPIVTLSIREGLEAVLASEYAYLSAAADGGALLAVLHAEVAARFILPYFYAPAPAPLPLHVASPPPPRRGGAAHGSPRTLRHRDGGGVGVAGTETLSAAAIHLSADASTAASAAPTATSSCGAQLQHQLHASAHATAGCCSGGKREHDITGAASLAEAYFCTSAAVSYMFPEPQSPQARLVRHMMAARQGIKACGDGRSAQRPATTDAPISSAAPPPGEPVRIGAHYRAQLHGSYIQQLRTEYAAQFRRKHNPEGAPRRIPFLPNDDSCPYPYCLYYRTATITTTTLPKLARRTALLSPRTPRSAGTPRSDPADVGDAFRAGATKPMWTRM
ncbi:hypothetical protein JKP88DRAFT_347407 [Tribonema minus]|uniref:Uncharacterized protein n=1 Tax=Tribonema minus TaxID=303371 RepID=A0A835ZFI8_9STRA|nr:hypothetical protein JKP88DRAFT_347407 [Tribonema minus]